MVKVHLSTLTLVYSKPDLLIRRLNEYIFDKIENNLPGAGSCYISIPDKTAHTGAGYKPLLYLQDGNNRTTLGEWTSLKNHSMIISH